jgi:hypothetical protein
MRLARGAGMSSGDSVTIPGYRCELQMTKVTAREESPM